MKQDEDAEAVGLMLAISDLRMEIVNRCINAAEEWHVRVYAHDKGARQSLMAAVAEAGERGLSNFDMKQTTFVAFFQERARAAAAVREKIEAGENPLLCGDCPEDNRCRTAHTGQPCDLITSPKVEGARRSHTPDNPYGPFDDDYPEEPSAEPDGRFDRLILALDDLVHAGGSADAVVDEMRTLLALLGMGGWISVKDRYPENGQEVIFVVEAGDEDYAGSIQKGHYHQYRFRDGEIDHEFSFPSRGTRASFWMPCPEPPNVPAEGKESV